MKKHIIKGLAIGMAAISILGAGAIVANPAQAATYTVTTTKKLTSKLHYWQKDAKKTEYNACEAGHVKVKFKSCTNSKGTIVVTEQGTIRNISYEVKYGSWTAQGKKLLKWTETRDVYLYVNGTKATVIAKQTRTASGSILLPKYSKVTTKYLPVQHTMNSSNINSGVSFIVAGSSFRSSVADVQFLQTTSGVISIGVITTKRSSNCNCKEGYNTVCFLPSKGKIVNGNVWCKKNTFTHAVAGCKNTNCAFTNP